jgi:4-cresol dehydrogenase (hydroxylating)
MPQVISPVLGGLGDPPNPEITRVLATPGGARAADLERLAQGKAFWNLRIVAYGPKEVARAKWEHAKRQFRQAIPDCRFHGEVSYDIPLTPAQEEALSPFSIERERKVSFGIPNLAIFAMGARSPAFPTPSDGHLWFSALIPRSGAGVMKAQNVFSQTLAELGVYIGLNAPMPLGYSPHVFLMLFPVFTSKTDPKINQQGRALLKKLIDVGAQNGWGEYRAAPALQDFIMDRLSFGDHALRRFCERLKDAADPNGILAAGRYGIWPRHIRETGRPA